MAYELIEDENGYEGYVVVPTPEAGEFARNAHGTPAEREERAKHDAKAVKAEEKAAKEAVKAAAEEDKAAHEEARAAEKSAAAREKAEKEGK